VSLADTPLSQGRPPSPLPGPRSVGINSAILSRSGGNVGIGFSIPANMARRIYTELVAKGKVTRGWLGVSIQPLTPELAKSFGLREAKGVLISDVVQDSPGEKAGIAAGDIITDFGDPLLDLVAAQEQRMVEEGRERRTCRRSVVWGDVPR
ncbi:MAG: PDZ domain-containing protein, partial [candidate division NC10 bacterium]